MPYTQPLIDPPLRIFQAFGGFTSGIGICYTDSLITDTQHQSYAKNLVIGQRILPQVFLRAADCRPFEIQDLLPSDARFKIILFIGDTSDSRQLGIINDLANELEGVLAKLAPLGHIFTMFDILAVCSDTKTSIRLGYKKLPILLRSHWSRYVFFKTTFLPGISIISNPHNTRVFIDDKDLQGTSGGDGYKNYGIDNKTGAIVIVRPDGYVGMISPLDKISDIDVYFGSFAISLDSSKI
jgi:phenol 2-monooxygenase